VHYGSAGHGSSQHLAAALFNHMVGGNMVHVPYKGGAPAVTDLLGGSIESVFAPLIEALPHIKSGAIKPLGLCGLKRSRSYRVCLRSASFCLDISRTSWNGIFAPAKTPRDIVDKMNAAIVKVLGQPNVRQHFAEADKEPVGNSPAQFKQFIAAGSPEIAHAGQHLRREARLRARPTTFDTQLQPQHRS
jgi:tripartite-type tricarboxylate transporter receptor subunit TctC